MATSRQGAVIDALVIAVDATDTLSAYDGMPALSTAPADFVVVGGTDEDEDDSVTTDQEWRGLGANARQETGEVVCCVISQTGGSTTTSRKEMRDRALDVLGQVEDALRADPTLGGTVTAGWLHVTGTRLALRNTPNGTYARLVFTVGYQARI